MPRAEKIGQKVTLKERARLVCEQVEERKKLYSLEWLGRSLAYNPYAPRELRSVLASTKEQPCKFIAKINPKSEDKEVARAPLEWLMHAKNCEHAHFSTLLITGDSLKSRGNLECLTQLRRYVPMPLLCGELIVDSYQIVEALVYGADAIFLSAKLLGTKELKKLLEYTLRMGLEGIIEISDKEDLTKAILVGAEILAINHELEMGIVDCGLSRALIPLIPQGKILIAMGGIASLEQVEELVGIGVDAVVLEEDFNLQNIEASALLPSHALNKN
ncbi:MAG: indole-3-glycerol phosphate synthase TrpC [Wolinella sp.]